MNEEKKVCKYCGSELEKLTIPSGVTTMTISYIATLKCRKCGSYFDAEGHDNKRRRQ